MHGQAYLEDASLRRRVTKILGTKKPPSVGELARLAKADGIIIEDDLITIVKGMIKDGSIVVQEPTYEIESPFDYIFTPTLSAWLWITLVGTALSITAVFLTPEIFPLIIFRWLLGSILVLFLPGYALLQTLFPKAAEMDQLERFALNIGLSLALVPLIGLILNYTPWGIRLVPIVASLGAFTIILTLAAATRKYLEAKQRSVSG